MVLTKASWFSINEINNESPLRASEREVLEGHSRENNFCAAYMTVSLETVKAVDGQMA